MRDSQRDRYDDHNRSSHRGGDRGRGEGGYSYPKSRGYSDASGNTETRRGRSRSRSRERGRDRHEREGSRDQDYANASDGRHNNNYHHHNDRVAGGGGSRRDDHYNEGYQNEDWARDKGRDRGREWDRDSDRDRDRDRGRGRFSRMSEPTNTVIIKGLPTHTTEPSLYAVLANFSPQKIRLISQRGTAECKGFAFVEFFSVEYAEYFVNSFAGSMGDDKAPQLIVENRAVVIDYATPRSEGDFSGASSSSSGEANKRGGGEVVSAKSDWLCGTCGCQNFARREKCYRCSAARTAQAVNVAVSLGTVDPYADVSIVGTSPSCTLAVRGLPLFANEDQIIEMFRQYAMVKNVYVVRDVKSHMSRGIAFVEFHSADHATHTMNSYNTQNPHSASSSTQPLKVHYAKESFLQGLSALQQQEQDMHHHQQQQQHHPPLPAPSLSQSTAANAPATSLKTQNAYARAALEAAQWSAASGAAPLLPTSTSTHTAPDRDRDRDREHHPITRSQGGSSSSFTTPSYFETHGVSYIFQPKTGIFYDAATKFYYCPKSRLYYSEVDGRYLYAVASEQKTGKHTPLAPPGIDFLEFVPAVPSSSLPDKATTTTQKATEELPKAAARKPITMSLGGFGSKKNKSEKFKIAATVNVGNTAASNTPANTPAIPAVLPSTAKQMTQNIAKWSEQKSSTDEQSSTPAAINKDTIRSSAAINATGGLSATVTPAAAVVCTLCRRQFASKEQLLRHERESKLHASNLAKANLAASTTGSSLGSVGPVGGGVGAGGSIVGGGQYRDRASERRAVHGQSAEDMSRVVPSDTDWVCNKCNCENFARRLSCFRCSASVSTSHGGAVDTFTSNRSSSSSIEDRTQTAHSSSSVSASAGAGPGVGVGVGVGPPGLNEDTENPGNQLLRRLGWKDGQGLGRGGSGDIESVATKLEKKQVGAGMGSSSVKRGVGVTPTAEIPSVAYGARGEGGAGKGEYRSSVLRAAKARSPHSALLGVDGRLNECYDGSWKGVIGVI